MVTGHQSELAQQWKRLLGCWIGMAVGVHSLAPYTMSLFIPALQREFGWSRLEVSAGPTILILGLGATAPFIGAVLDRGYTRILVTFSAVALSLGFLALSQTPGEIGWFLGTIAVMGVAGSACCTPAFSRVINLSFDRARGTALGIALSSNGLVGTVTPPLIAAAIANDGWRSAYLILAIVTAAAVPVLWLTMPRRSRDRSAALTVTVPAESLREIFRDRVAWALAFCAVAVALGASGFVAHLVPMLTDSGMPAREAALYASVIGLSVFFARLGTGILIDRFFAPHVAALLFAMSGLGFFALAAFGAGAAPLGAAAIGVSIGAEIDLIGYLTARYFGTQSYGKIFGCLFTCYLAGSAASPLFYGLAHMHLGDYTAGLVVGGVLLLITSAVFLRLPAFGVRSSSAASLRPTAN